MVAKKKSERREEVFCREYVVDLNGTRAAIAAGYAKKSARVTASRLLTKANIQEKMVELQKAVTDKLDLTAEMVLAELKKIAFCSDEKKVMVRDRIRALELLGKHLKLFTDRVEVNGLDGLAERIAEARKRVNDRREKKRVSIQ